MDLFKFTPGADPTILTGGVYLNNIKTVQWVERYRDAGEFEITAGVSSDLRSILPVGSMISHLDTLEVMLVESISIKDDDKEEEPKLSIRGRSLESWLRHRFVGDDVETYVLLGQRLYVNNIDYNLLLDTSWAQAVTLIEHHINNMGAIPNDEVVGFVPISNQQHIGPSTALARIVRKQNLHSAVLELLAIDDFGIQTVRPNSGNVDPTTTEFRIHNGVDRSDSVIFSHTFGDLDASEYFWSDAALKTEYYCVSTFFEMRSDEGVSGFNRRVMFVDCSDIDSHLSDDEVTDVGVADAVGAAMDARGQQALRSQVAVSLLATDVSRNTRYKFKRDYDVGDLVTVNGNYDVETIMRVVEHVSFQDENGESGYPTLAALNE